MSLKHHICTVPSFNLINIFTFILTTQCVVHISEHRKVHVNHWGIELILDPMKVLSSIFFMSRPIMEWKAGWEGA